MKRVLIVGFLYPLVQTGGSYRTLPLAKYLTEFNWESIVLTPALEQQAELPFRIIETHYRDALAVWKKMLGFNPNKDIRVQVQQRFGASAENPTTSFLMSCLGAVLNYPDSFKSWIPVATKAAVEAFRSDTIDAIISCHPVATSSVIASNLKAHYNVPWIADFSDLWSRNHNYHYGPVRRLLDTRLEKKTIARADRLATVVPAWADTLRSMHKDKQVYMLPHGYDPEEVNKGTDKLTEKFTITYTGSLYTGKQDLELFVSSLDELIEQGEIRQEDIEVRFFGRKDSLFDDIVSDLGVTGVIKHYGVLPRREMLPVQRESQMLLAINWEGKERAGYQLKLFEYLAARRPILATGGIGNYLTQKMLDESGAGVYAPLKENIKEALRRYYREYKDKGSVVYRGIEDKVESYSYRHIAGQFAGILDEVSEDASRLK